MKKCFDLDEDIIKQKHKKSIVISILLLVIIIVCEVVLMVILNRENTIIILSISLVLFVLFTFIFCWFMFYKRPYYKVYLNGIKKSKDTLIEKECLLIEVGAKPFCKEGLEFFALKFKDNKKEIDLEILSDKKDDFIVNKTYHLCYKGAVLYKYEIK